MALNSTCFLFTTILSVAFGSGDVDGNYYDPWKTNNVHDTVAQQLQNMRLEQLGMAAQSQEITELAAQDHGITDIESLLENADLTAASASDPSYTSEGVAYGYTGESSYNSHAFDQAALNPYDQSTVDQSAYSYRNPMLPQAGFNPNVQSTYDQNAFPLGSVSLNQAGPYFYPISTNDHLAYPVAQQAAAYPAFQPQRAGYHKRQRQVSVASGSSSPRPSNIVSPNDLRLMELSRAEISQASIAEPPRQGFLSNEHTHVCVEPRGADCGRIQFRNITRICTVRFHSKKPPMGHHKYKSVSHHWCEILDSGNVCHMNVNTGHKYYFAKAECVTRNTGVFCTCTLYERNS